MPAKRSANSGQSPASSKRSKTTTKKVDFEIRPTFHTEQASTHAFPTDIDSLDVDHVLVAGDLTDSDWYQWVLDRLSYYSSEFSQASDDQRCRYVWNLWNQFSLRRLWMAAGYTHEAEWASQNEEVYRYVYYTLGYGASQLNLVPPSTFRGLSAPVGKLHTQFGELWMYELGLFGNPWTQSTGRDLFGKVAELLGTHEVTTIKAALEYSTLGKIRYGRLKVLSKAQEKAKNATTERHEESLAPLPVLPLRSNPSKKILAELERIRMQRYPMRSDWPDVVHWLTKPEQHDVWKAVFSALGTSVVDADSYFKDSDTQKPSSSEDLKGNSDNATAVQQHHQRDDDHPAQESDHVDDSGIDLSQHPGQDSAEATLDAQAHGSGSTLTKSLEEEFKKKAELEALVSKLKEEVTRAAKEKDMAVGKQELESKLQQAAEQLATFKKTLEADLDKANSALKAQQESASQLDSELATTRAALLQEIDKASSAAKAKDESLSALASELATARAALAQEKINVSIEYDTVVLESQRKVTGAEAAREYAQQETGKQKAAAKSLEDEVMAHRLQRETDASIVVALQGELSAAQSQATTLAAEKVKAIAELNLEALVAQQALDTQSAETNAALDVGRNRARELENALEESNARTEDYKQQLHSAGETNTALRSQIDTAQTMAQKTLQPELELAGVSKALADKSQTELTLLREKKALAQALDVATQDLNTTKKEHKEKMKRNLDRVKELTGKQAELQAQLKGTDKQLASQMKQLNTTESTLTHLERQILSSISSRPVVLSEPSVIARTLAHVTIKEKSVFAGLNRLEGDNVEHVLLKEKEMLPSTQAPDAIHMLVTLQYASPGREYVTFSLHLDQAIVTKAMYDAVSKGDGWDWQAVYQRPPKYAHLALDTFDDA
ncbi:hypothetical protein QFC24_005970 [Naganishia onofrii]|uniref:Uncharacterized protein n=1 Tax=Naganishia onofrii TaxID=1851511 RepID=A0ACC2X5S2_9TREE|nr:hypothetical protein QFC24_005970 [Naganishia onofrii]